MPRVTIDIWCHKHWDPVLSARSDADPINGTAATEFLLRRFNADLEKDHKFPQDPELQGEWRKRALADLAPICCLYDDDSIQELRERCRFSRLALSHPQMNDDDDPEGLHHPIRNGHFE